MKNRKIFRELMDHTMVGRMIPGILCQSIEFQKFKVRGQKELGSLAALKKLEKFQGVLP